MCRGEKLMHEWGIVSWLKFRECKKLGRSNIKLVKIVKKLFVNWEGNIDSYFG